MSKSEYVLGTNEAELLRLGFQHRVWGEATFALWDRAGFRPGHSILDVGCGPGYATLDLAQIVGPAGRVVAVDVADNFIEHLKSRLSALGLKNVEPILGNVQSLEIAPGGMDGAYARWVLCFVPDPEAVVAGVARALRPGGVFAVQDYVHYRSVTVSPRSAVFDRVVTATDESWRQRGGDPDICMRLPEMMVRCGFEIREIKSLVRVGRPGSILWHWPQTFFTDFIPKLMELGLLTERDQREFAQDWAQRSSNPAAFFITPAMVEIVAVRK